MPATMTPNSLHIFVSGRVHGVGFRYFIQREAVRLGLAGWVRNLPDGRVEIEAHGERESLDDLLSAARRGPQLSHVTDVVEEWRSAEATARGFSIRHDTG